MGILKSYIVLYFTFSSFLLFSQNRMERFENIYQSSSKNTLINDTITLNDVYDSCYIHYYKSRVYFFNNQIDSSKSELLTFIDKAKVLPNFEDLAAMFYAKNMCLLMMEEFKRVKDIDRFIQWKKMYFKSSYSIHSCVKRKTKRIHPVELVFEEMIKR